MTYTGLIVPLADTNRSSLPSYVDMQEKYYITKKEFGVFLSRPFALKNDDDSAYSLYIAGVLPVHSRKRIEFLVSCII